MYYLMNVEVHTDEFSNDKFVAGFKNSYTDVDYLIRHETATNLAEFYIYADNSLSTINRTYQKLPDALASLVGMANLIMFLCFFYTNLANRLEIIIENKNLKEFINENKNIKEHINQNQNIVEPTNNPILENKKSKFNTFVKKPFNYQENDNAKLQIGLLEYIKCKIGIFFKFKGNKYKLLKKAEQVLVKELDIIRLLPKLHEIEKLKLLLLNEDQLVLFDSISKPFLEIDNDRFDANSNASFMTKLIKNYKEKKDINSIQRSYKRLQANQTTNPLNDKLIRLIDDKIKLDNKD